MSKIGFKLDQEFCLKIHAQLEQLRTEFNSDLPLKNGDPIAEFQEVRYEPSTVPNPAILREILEVAFWASLEREEDRPLVFAVDYYSGIHVVPIPFRFNDPLEFNTDNIVRLAPTMSGRQWILAVEETHEGKLQIIGLLPNDGLAVIRESPVQVKAINPGRIVVSFMRVNVAVLSPAVSSIINNAFLSYTSDIWRLIEPADDTKTREVFKLVVEIAHATMRSIFNLGHGGTLIIVPETNEWLKFVHRPLRYKQSNGMGRYDRFDGFRRLVNEERLNLAFDLKRRFLDEASILGALTAVDGAVIVNPQFEAIAFGAKLTNRRKSGASDIRVITPLHEDGGYEDIPITELGNTRHQSAANFIYNHPDAIAFVVSQDKRVSVIIGKRHEDGEVELMACRQMEVTLF